MKKSDLKEFIREEIIEILSEVSTEEEIDQTKELTKAVQDLQKAKEEAGLTEDIDAEKAEKEVTIDPKDSVVQLADKLADVAKEMKSVNNQYKKAKGAEKESLLKRLKQLTKIKQELEGLL